MRSIQPSDASGLPLVGINSPAIFLEKSLTQNRELNSRSSSLSVFRGIEDAFFNHFLQNIYIAVVTKYTKIEYLCYL
ncbi:hypothetical protein J4464_06175, partial [Candidatus Woesearchaeota archaeon]|nr:hypothetical protein [Candidatus Woesearchaeota archaeon]